MKNALPLVESTGTEICIRTVYQIILADYKLNPEQYDHAAQRLYELAYQWRLAGLQLIADYLTNAAEHITSGHTIASWKTLHTSIAITRVVALARLGRGPKR